MAERRRIKFTTTGEVIADITALRAGPYEKAGTWSLEQIAWHCCQAIPSPLTEAPDEKPSEAEAKFQELLKGFSASEQVPAGFPADPRIVPPPTASAADVDELIKRLKSLDTFKGQRVRFGPAGVAPFQLVKEFGIAHASHHLSFLVPQTSRRQGLRYKDFDALIADIENLRRGYKKTGNWSLAQMAWHLNQSTNRLLGQSPGEETPEQIARKPMLEKVITSGQLPSGIEGPAPMMPSADVPESAVDEYLATLRSLKNRMLNPTSHRLFGNISAEQFRQLLLIHPAHHLSHLVPDSNGRS